MRSLRSWIVFSSTIFQSTSSFSAPSANPCRSAPAFSRRKAHTNERFSPYSAHGFADSPPPSEPSTPIRRRSFLGSSATAAAAAASSSILLPPPAAASYVEPDIDCLLDVPPPSANSVRVYLCRHGETENNRLHLHQGPRVDARLNSRGVAQSERIGLALSRLVRKPPGLLPRVAVHSGMARSAQTVKAAIEATGVGRDGVLFRRKGVRTVCMPSLRSIDCGPYAGGREASEVYAGMARTYGAWTSGHLDARPDGGGESGREVLGRAAAALRALAKIAGTTAGPILAVSHSSYIRILLAILLGVPLEEATTLSLGNGCINVVDLWWDGWIRTVGTQSTLYYEGPRDFQLRVPRGRVLRVNETRHLGDICCFIPRY